MNKKALRTIRKYDMISKGDNIIAAVSGGADSMALLCFLLDIRDKYRLNVSVCHINHLLRGIDAERDEAFVRSFCQKNLVPFFLLRTDVAALAKERKIGFEECGRQVRYAFLSETAEKLGRNTKIATAHTLSDCGETLIFNIARGTSPTGISSIAPKRDNIIRPLIECTRDEVESFLLEKRQTYMVDNTNQDGSYRRNFIRKEIIPKLKTLNPAFDTSVLNLTELSRQQADFINKTVALEYSRLERNGGIYIEGLNSLHPAIKSGIIAELFRKNNIEFSKKRCDDVLSILEREKFRLSVCKDGYIFCKGDSVLRFERNKKTADYSSFSIPFKEGFYSLPTGDDIRITQINRETFKNIKKDFPEKMQNCFNMDIANCDFVVRFRREGDFISLFPRNVTKNLKKLLNESKKPLEERNIIPLVAFGSHILWGNGIGIDRAARVDEHTKNILFIEVFEK